MKLHLNLKSQLFQETFLHALLVCYYEKPISDCLLAKAKSENPAGSWLWISAHFQLSTGNSDKQISCCLCAMMTSTFPAQLSTGDKEKLIYGLLSVDQYISDYKPAKMLPVGFHLL